jgi:hypothetical protein
VFRTTLQRILTTKGCPDRWDLNQYAADIRDFLGDYESRYDVVGENQEGYINPNTVATKTWWQLWK